MTRQTKKFQRGCMAWCMDKRLVKQKRFGVGSQRAYDYAASTFESDKLYAILRKNGYIWSVRKQYWEARSKGAKRAAYTFTTLIKARV